MPPTSDLLLSAYEELDLATESLKVAGAAPRGDQDPSEWAEVGEWLTIASRAGAERIFFVDGEPVLVFANLASSSENAILKAYRQAWCMARPSCLFISVPGELRVYSLGHLPARNEEEWRQIDPLAVVNRASDVAEKLDAFRRPNVESKKVFQTLPPDTFSGRADRRLISDLAELRSELLRLGLPLQHAHTLIARSIFVRYLEDREILDLDFFREVAGAKSEWHGLLSSKSPGMNASATGPVKPYTKILSDKTFAYAFFRSLAQEFNGDLLNANDGEELSVQQEHLTVVQEFLLGTIQDRIQKPLFLWAYDFSIVPMELISSIYEEFYHQEENVDVNGTHYTPLRLVEDVLRRTLTPAILSSKPRVLDPACGSGIFLVQAFKRIARYAAAEKGDPLSMGDLKEILRNQLAGIEINEEAARIAAFSLYLAILGFLDPPSIRAHSRLPSLLVNDQERDENNLHTLYNGNAFSPTQCERDELERSSVTKGASNRRRYLDLTSDTLPFSRYDFDVIIGNPPWEEAENPKGSSVHRQTRGSLQEKYRRAGQAAALWAECFDRPVGDNSYSQLFLHRSLALAKPEAVIGLLLHASVLFNQRTTSVAFRQHLLSHAVLTEVINYSHVRHLYFERGVAPFIYLGCYSTQPTSDTKISYTTARLTPVAVRTRSGVITGADRKLPGQSELISKDYLWKTYSWGSHRDATLMAALDMEPSLADLLPDVDEYSGFGFQKGTKEVPAELRALPVLSTKNLTWYGPLQPRHFEATPTGVKRTPDSRLYHGPRLIATRGARGAEGLCVRLEYEPFAFRHTICAIRLSHLDDWQAKTIAAIFWSNLGRYRVFMQAGSWGTWHDQFVKQDWLSMPAPLPESPTPLIHDLVAIVDEIRTSAVIDLAGETRPTEPPRERLALLNELVYELFGLGPAERDLVRDWAEFTYSLFKDGADSTAVTPVRISDRTSGSMRTFEKAAGLREYLRAFVGTWDPYLSDRGSTVWTTLSPPGIPFVAVALSDRELSATLIAQDWGEVLSRISQHLPDETSSSLYVDGLLRVVAPNLVFVAKRNESRLWTASMGREDAEASLVHAIGLQEHQPSPV